MFNLHMLSSEIRLSRLAARQFSVVTRAQILDCGISTRTVSARLTSGIWKRIMPAIFAVEARDRWTQLLVAAQLWSAPSGVISHRAAAALWKLGEFPKDRVDIIHATKRSNQPLVQLHYLKLERGDIARRGPFMLTSPMRTLIDLGAVVGEEEVEAALDEGLRRRLIKIDKLEDRLRGMRAKGRNGVGTLARILQARGAFAKAAESPLETRVARMIRSAKLPDPVRQMELALPTGDRMRFDFGWPDYQTVVEVDSRRYHSDENTFHRDREKSNALALLGWHLIRITHRDMAKRRVEIRQMLQAALNYSSRQGRMGL